MCCADHLEDQYGRQPDHVAGDHLDPRSFKDVLTYVDLNLRDRLRVIPAWATSSWGLGRPQPARLAWTTTIL